MSSLRSGFSRRILHGRVNLVYFAISGTYGLCNIITGNTGYGLHILILTYISLDTLWIIADSHLAKERTWTTFFHHFGAAVMGCVTATFHPLRIFASYGIVIELSGCLLFLLKSFILPPHVYRVVRVINIAFWFIFRLSVPMFAALYFTRWWAIGQPMGILILVGTIFMLVFIMGPNIAWTVKMHRAKWHVRPMSELRACERLSRSSSWS